MSTVVQRVLETGQLPGRGSRSIQGCDGHHDSTSPPSSLVGCSPFCLPFPEWATPGSQAPHSPRGSAERRAGREKGSRQLAASREEDGLGNVWLPLEGRVDHVETTPPHSRCQQKTSQTSFQPQPVTFHRTLTTEVDDFSYKDPGPWLWDTGPLTPPAPFPYLRTSDSSSCSHTTYTLWLCGTSF